MKKTHSLEDELINGGVHVICCKKCWELSGCEINGIQKYCPTIGRCHNVVCPIEQGYFFVFKLDVCPCCIEEGFLSEEGLCIPILDTVHHYIM